MSKRLRKISILLILILALQSILPGCISSAVLVDLFSDETTSVRISDNSGTSATSGHSDGSSDLSNAASTSEASSDQSDNTDIPSEPEGTASPETTGDSLSEATQSDTSAPTTQAPTPQAPTTEAPTTQAPTTEAPATQAPTTQASTTQAPTTEAPTTQAPTTQAATEPATTQQEATSAVISYATAPGNPEDYIYWPYSETAAQLALAKSVADSLGVYGASDLAKVRAVHDYLVKTISYDTTLIGNTIEAALDGNCCVCQGYADAFAAICYYLGIEAPTAYGTAYNGSSTENHAWNQVKVDGEWYNIDVTWDDPLPDGQLRYNYFLVTDSVLSIDHTTQGVVGGTIYSCTNTKYASFQDEVTLSNLTASLDDYIIINNTSDFTDLTNYINNNSSRSNYYIVYDFGNAGATVESVSYVFNSIGNSYYYSSLCGNRYYIGDRYVLFTLSR